jgi:hypothetical protein
MTGVKAPTFSFRPRRRIPDPIAYAGEVARAVRQASRESGLERLVLLSPRGRTFHPDRPIRGLHTAEEILAGAAPRVTFLRATYFRRTGFPRSASHGSKASCRRS